MSHPTTPADTTREAYRRPDGQFGNQPAAESETDLATQTLDSVAAAVDELSEIIAEDRELRRAGWAQGSRARTALAASREEVMGNITAWAPHVELEDAGGKTVVYAGNGTLVFDDGSYSRADGPVGRPAPELPQDPAEPVDVTHPAVQAGAVRDVVTSGGQTFHRRQEGVYPAEPYAMRFQSERPITDDQMERSAQLIGYSYAMAGRGEGIGIAERDSPYSFVVGSDTTKGRVYRHLDVFEENLPGILASGSPVRSTDRAGAGTKGTRLVEGMGPEAPTFELYYDSVFETRGAAPREPAQ